MTIVHQCQLRVHFSVYSKIYSTSVSTQLLVLKFEYSQVSPWKLVKILIVGLLGWDPEI